MFFDENTRRFIVLLSFVLSAAFYEIFHKKPFFKVCTVIFGIIIQQIYEKLKFIAYFDFQEGKTSSRSAPAPEESAKPNTSGSVSSTVTFSLILVTFFKLFM